jgi:hypothetical protein
MEKAHRGHLTGTGRPVIVSVWGFAIGDPFGTGSGFCFQKSCLLYPRKYSKFRKATHTPYATQRLMDQCFASMMLWSPGGIGLFVIAMHKVILLD